MDAQGPPSVDQCRLNARVPRLRRRRNRIALSNPKRQSARRDFLKRVLEQKSGSQNIWSKTGDNASPERTRQPMVLSKDNSRTDVSHEQNHFGRNDRNFSDWRFACQRTNSASGKDFAVTGEHRQRLKADIALGGRGPIDRNRNEQACRRHRRVLQADAQHRWFELRLCQS